MPAPRWRLGLAAALLLPACLPTYPPAVPQGSADAAGLAGDASGGTGPVAFFNSNVQPIMQNACVVCHATGSAYPVFLVAPDFRASMLAAPNSLVVPGSPDTSTLLTIGTATTHTGVELTPDQATTVRSWIEMEQ